MSPFSAHMRREGTFRFFMVIFSQNTLHIIEIYAILFPKAAIAPPPPCRLPLGRYFLKGI